MSLIRFTSYKQNLYAPDVNGAFSAEPFDGTAGLLGEFAGPAQITAGRPINTYLDEALEIEARRLAPGAPVAVMVHGFQFDPRDDVSGAVEQAQNPHQRIFHFNRALGGAPLAREKKFHSTGWPVRLGFAEDDEGAAGVAIAFGWYSNPGFFDSMLEASKDFHQLAYHFGGLTTWPFIAALHALAKSPALAGHPIDIFCHSLGSRVVVNAIQELCRHAPSSPRLAEALSRLGRIVLVGGSEMANRAKLAANATAGLPSASGIAFYNAVLRKDGVLDHLAEKTHVAEFPMNQVIGHNGMAPERFDNWIDLQLDSAPLQRWLAGKGTPIDGGEEEGFASHWVYYTYPDNMALYRRILRDRAKWSIAQLRAAGIPDAVRIDDDGN